MVQEDLFFSNGSNICGVWQQMSSHSQHLDIGSTDYIPRTYIGAGGLSLITTTLESATALPI